MKSYTDIEQSKKLAEILPLESADYYHATDAGVVVTTPYITYCGEERCVPAYKGAVPCWSLAVLLNILPNGNVLVKTTGGEYYCLDNDVMTAHYKNPIDACVEFVLKLHELKML